MNFLTSIRMSAQALMALLLTESAALAQSQVVFDNTPNLINQTPFFFSAQEYGDEIALAGSARQVTEFQFAYYGDFGTNPAVNFVLRFYANDGSDADPGSGVARRPKSLLWDSGAQSALLNGVNKVTVPIPDIPVPDSFTWTIVFNGIDGTPGKRAAVMLANPAIIGALLSGTPAMPGLIGSYDDFWKQETPADPETWTLFSFGFNENDPKGNFFAKVTAVPYHPELQIARAANKVVLSWPAVASGYVLERNDNLADGNNWVPIVTKPTSVNGLNSLTNDVVGTSAVFRLRHPE